MTIARATAYARQIASGPYGYSQGTGKTDGRWSGLDHSPGNFDCSSASGAIAFMGGFIERSDLKGTFYSGNIVQRLVNTGMYFAIHVSKLALSQLKAKLREGDILRGEGHVVYSLGGGKIVSFENDERGKSSGGRAGDQTGREGRVRDLYARSRGWSTIARPYSPETFLGRALAAYSKGVFPAGALAQLKRRAPWDGPRWESFFHQWKIIDRGLAMNATLEDFSDMTLSADHIFVVLGSGLKADGSMPGKFERRLRLALTMLNRFPGTRVLVSGGAPKNGITEAAAGKKWLLAEGVAEDRILVEEKSSSTIGNAKYSLPILAQHTSCYTLISDASHLRRAQVEFLAAQVQLETLHNKELKLGATKPIAFNDYAPGVVSTALPISAGTRATIAREVATLLGITEQYKAGL